MHKGGHTEIPLISILRLQGWASKRLVCVVGTESPTVTLRQEDSPLACSRDVRPEPHPPQHPQLRTEALANVAVSLYAILPERGSGNLAWRNVNLNADID